MLCLPCALPFSPQCLEPDCVLFINNQDAE